jgi:peptidoglycan/LPS O-acetylase OafA/YrhL
MKGMVELKRLTSLRFFFAAWVFLSHCDFILGEKNNAYQHLFSYGYIGVGFFFILSGFILSYVYKRSILDKSVSYVKFVRLRIFRLYPLYFLTLICAIPLVWSHVESVGTFLRNFFIHAGMIQSFIPAENIYFGFNGPSWSVSDEMFFYLLFPLIILNFRKSIFLYLSGLLFTIVFYLIMFRIQETPPHQAEHYFYYINPVMRLSDFLFGIILYSIFEKNIRLPNYSTILAASALIIFFMFNSYIPAPLLYSVYFYLPVGMLVLSAADEHQQSWLDKILTQKFLVYAGRISYGLYLYHILVLRAVEFAARKMQIDLNPYFQMGISFTLLLAVTIFSYEFFEKPLNAKLRATSDKQPN